MKDDDETYFGRRLRRAEDKIVSHGVRIDTLEKAKSQVHTVEAAREIVLASIPPPSLEAPRFGLGVQLTDSGLHVRQTVDEHQKLLAENAAAKSFAAEFKRLTKEAEAAKALKRQNWVISKTGGVLVAVVTVFVLGVLALLVETMLEQRARRPSAAVELPSSR
jgi:hypothetical protein